MKLRVKPSVVMLFLAFLAFISVSPAHAALFTIASSGNGVFTLRGADLTNVGGIDVTVGYDTATLANPRVVQGGMGGLFVANTKTPGAIRILVISSPTAIAGSGVVATITFDRQGGSEGKILSLSPGPMIDTDGKRLPAPQTQISNPVETASTEEKAPTQQRATGVTTQTPAETITSSSGGYGVPGTITIPGETEEAPKQQPTPQAVQEPATEAKGEPTRESAAETETKDEAPAVEPPAPPKQVVYPSVLDGFRLFKGDKTPKSLTALFDAAAIPGVRQEPAVVLSDGKATVKVFITLQFTGKDAPHFALNGAKLVSLKQEEDAWVLEALPDIKGYEAAVTVQHNGSRTEIPLVVAPPADGNFDEAGFNRFLMERGTEKSPKHDLNSDGKRNYVDDYIFTANYIVKVKEKEKKKGAEKKK